MIRFINRFAMFFSFVLTIATSTSTSSSNSSIFDLIEQAERTVSSADVDEADHQEPAAPVTNAPAVQPANQRYVYNMEQVFANDAECMEFIANEGCWRQHDVITQSSGVKAIYWCNRVKCRGGRCLAEIYVKYDMVPGDERRSLYRREQAHTCENAPNKIIKLPAEIERSIETLIDLKILPRNIMVQLRLDFPNAEFTKVQVYSYYKKHRKALFGKSKLSVEEMVRFCEANINVPESMDDAFVLAYDHSPLDMDEETDDAIEALDDLEDNMPWFRYIISTKRLLENSAISTNICADATKKIMLHKFQILHFGTTDMDSTQHFHLMASMISKHERAVDFEFGFKAIQDAVQRIFNRRFEPKILMRDAAMAIHNGFAKAFGDKFHSLMCYSHVKRAIDRRHVDHGVDKGAIKKDLDLLRLAFDDKTFEIGAELFLEKWRKISKEFADYFEATWLRHNSKWYNGAVYRMVTTNNGMENFNGLFKRFHTHWKIVGLNQFKVDAMGIMKKESMMYDKDKAPFKTDITISNHMRKDGNHYAKTKSIVMRKENGMARFYMRCGDSVEPLSGDDVDQFLNQRFESFDEFAKHMFDIYTVTFCEDAAEWKETATCNCPSFADNFICKHVMAVVYKLGIERYREEHFLNESAPRGRPKNATPALVVD